MNSWTFLRLALFNVIFFKKTFPYRFVVGRFARFLDFSCFKEQGHEARDTAFASRFAPCFASCFTSCFASCLTFLGGGL